jgi:hypothetical protein
MKHVRGAALPLGVTISEEKINFSVAAGQCLRTVLI